MALQGKQPGGQYSEVGGGDYDQTPEEGVDYTDFIKYVSDQKMMGIKKFKHSEFKNPMAKNYETMDTTYDWPSWQLPPWWPSEGGNPPAPGGAAGPEVPKIIQPPVKRCDCDKLQIKYTTLTMAKGTTQILRLTGIIHQELCDDASISWSLSGAGSLYPYDGFYTVYQAPSSADCGAPAVITASCWGSDTSITIHVSSVDYGGALAYTVRECQYNAECQGAIGKHCALVFSMGYNCMGAAIGLVCGCGACSTSATCEMSSLESFCNGYLDVCWMTCDSSASICKGCPTEAGAVGSVKDKRTAEMIAGGCCPTALF